MMRTLAMAFCFLASAGLAAAQTHQEQGIFIHAGGLASIDRDGHYVVPPSTAPSLALSSDPGGTVGAGTVGIGVFLRPMLSVRADFTLASEHVSTTTVTETLPSTIYDLVDLVGFSPGTITATSRTKNQGVDLLLAYHLPSGRRVRIAILGGAAFLRRWSDRVSETSYPPSSTIPPIFAPRQPQRDQTVLVTYPRALVAGLDAEIALNEKLALVPQLRAGGTGGNLSIRPGIVLRWHP